MGWPWNVTDVKYIKERRSPEPTVCFLCQLMICIRIKVESREGVLFEWFYEVVSGACHEPHIFQVRGIRNIPMKI